MTALTSTPIPNPAACSNRWLPKVKSLLSILALALLTNNPVSATPTVSQTPERSHPVTVSTYHPVRSNAITQELESDQTTSANSSMAVASAASKAPLEFAEITTPYVTDSPQEIISPVVTTRLDPQDWQNWPVVPTLSERMLSVYQDGLAMGNNPQAFTKIGDGEISALWFLTEFDLGAEFYNLGPYTELLPTIEYFAGSFGHSSQAARRGFNTTRILDPSLADPNLCNPGETPLTCELRMYRPSFALVSLGTNQVWAPEVLEPGLRQIIETLLANNVIPVLSTKADNLEEDFRINTIIAGLAAEYDAPLWNFWRAVQPLPEHGLQEDLEHLTYAPNDFDDPIAMEHAWPVRNLTALQVLAALWEAVR